MSVHSGVAQNSVKHFHHSHACSLRRWDQASNFKIISTTGWVAPAVTSKPYDDAKKSFFMASVHHVNYDYELIADTFKVSEGAKKGMPVAIRFGSLDNLPNLAERFLLLLLAVLILLGPRLTFSPTSSSWSSLGERRLLAVSVLILARFRRKDGSKPCSISGSWLVR